MKVPLQALVSSSEKWAVGLTSWPPIQLEAQEQKQEYIDIYFWKLVKTHHASG